MRLTLVVSADSEEEIAAALWGMLAMNLHIMNRNWPSIYASGIRYRREPPGTEVWQTAGVLLQTMLGDCEDLAAYQAAYLRVSGIDPGAKIGLKRSSVGYHVIVLRSDGVVEDPSARLGMDGDG